MLIKMLAKTHSDRCPHCYMFRINFHFQGVHSCMVEAAVVFVVTLILTRRFSFGSVPFWCLMFSCLWLDSCESKHKHENIKHQKV
jgi:hypothetical protein